MLNHSVTLIVFRSILLSKINPYKSHMSRLMVDLPLNLIRQ